MSKEIKKSNKYKATDPGKFKEWFTESSPGYKDLCEGKSVTLKKSKMVDYWLTNKIIEKE